MKRKSLSELLTRLENVQSPENHEIYSLNDQLARKMLKGGYATTNGSCIGVNDSCENTSCKGSNNNTCWNHGCLE